LIICRELYIIQEKKHNVITNDADSKNVTITTNFKRPLFSLLEAVKVQAGGGRARTLQCM